MLDLDECPHEKEVGGKAEFLSRVRRSGLPVPPGVVVLPKEPIDEEELTRRLRGYLNLEGGGRFVVRSSSALEDRPGRSAAGLLRSIRDVHLKDVAKAVAEVRSSGDGAAVRGYLGGPVEVAVLIQPQVEAWRLGVLLLLDGQVSCEERPPEEPEWGHVEARQITEADSPVLFHGVGVLQRLLLSGVPEAERISGQLADAPVQVEYAVMPDGEVVFLQGRLLRKQQRPPSADPSESWDAPEGSLPYLLDKEHNPDPLSAAQASLVELSDPEVRPLGLRLAVRRGYLYYAQGTLVTAGGRIPPEQLPRRYRDEILPACVALLAPVEQTLPSLGGKALPRALQAYLDVYRRYVGQITPAIRRARGYLDQFLIAHLGERVDRHTALLSGLDTITLRRAQALYGIGKADSQPEQDLRLAAYIAEYGAFAPCWDVALPCDGEVPGRVLELASLVARGEQPEIKRKKAEALYKEALDRVLSRLPQGPAAALRTLVPMVRAALALSEDDDALFFRAQQLLRRALLLRGEQLFRAGELDDREEVFDLPITALLPEELGAALGVVLHPGNLREQAAENRRNKQEHRALVPPDRFVAGRPLWSVPKGPVLRGCGVPAPDPAPVRGLARVVASLDQDLARLPDVAGRILVLPALLPSWCPLLFSARALVTESGGGLSHGATLAREASVPAVVGVAGAISQIQDGDEVVVDAQAGIVCKVSEE